MTTNYPHTTTITSRFAAAHRLPALGGLCTNLHGHNWEVRVELTADVDPAAGVAFDFAAFKQPWSEVIDGMYDHSCMLGDQDPLLEPISKECPRVIVFGGTWPTVEMIASRLHFAASQIAESLGACCVAVQVAETPTNTVTYRPLAA